MLRIGSLCSGYGGLELGVQAVYGGSTAWVSDIDKGACKILAHRFPGVPNIGDMTAVDWSAVEPVDLICGGTPCQDLSHAGKRAGMTEGTRSNLWVSMREAIATIRPALVVWENVAGALSARADSEVEREPGLLGDRSGRPALRALGRVLGDLASLGYDADWHSLRAADVGAPHGRLRVFVVATDAQRGGRDGWSPDAGRGAVGRVAAQGAGEGALLPSPRTSDTNGAGVHGDGGLDLRTAVTHLPTPSARDYKDHTIRREPHRPDDTDTLARALTDVPAALLPTPAVNDMGAAYTPEQWDAWTADMKAKHGNGNGHGPSLNVEAQRLLPTPRAGDGEKGGPNQRGSSGDLMLPSAVQQDWGKYADAIRRWETLTRPAPAPTELGPKGAPRLSPAFSEWMMGLPAGWVTDVPGITRNEALRALGNGVVPQQATEALRVMAAWEAVA